MLPPSFSSPHPQTIPRTMLTSRSSNAPTPRTPIAPPARENPLPPASPRPPTPPQQEAARPPSRPSAPAPPASSARPSTPPPTPTAPSSAARSRRPVRASARATSRPRRLLLLLPRRQWGVRSRGVQLQRPVSASAVVSAEGSPTRSAMYSPRLRLLRQARVKRGLRRG